MTMNAPLNLYFNKGCIHVVGEWVIAKTAVWHIAEFKADSLLGNDDIDLSRVRNNYIFTKAIDDAIKKEGNSGTVPKLLFHDENIVVTDRFFVIGRDACWSDEIKEVQYTDKPICALRVVLANGKTLEHRSMLSKTLPDARDALQRISKAPIDPKPLTAQPLPVETSQPVEKSASVQTMYRSPILVKTPIKTSVPSSADLVHVEDQIELAAKDELKLDMVGRNIDSIEIIERPENEHSDISADDVDKEVLDELIRESEDDAEGNKRSGVEPYPEVFGERPSRRPLYGDEEAEEKQDYFETKRLVSDEEPEITANEAQEVGDEVYYSGMAGLVTNKRIKSPHGYWLVSHIKAVDYAVLPWHMQPGAQAKIITWVIIFIVLIIVAKGFAFFIAMVVIISVAQKVSFKPKGVVTFTLYTGTKAYIVDRPEYGGELPQLAGAVRRALFDKKW